MIAIIVASIAAFASILASVLGFYNRRSIQEVHVLFNSRMTQLLELTQKASFAEGEKSGQNQTSK
jgi:hypothetical protein